MNKTKHLEIYEETHKLLKELANVKGMTLRNYIALIAKQLAKDAE